MGDLGRRIAQRALHGRGVEERAEADHRRRLEDAMIAEQRRKTRPAKVVTLSVEALKPWVEMFAKLSGRPMSIERVDHDRRLTVAQRCRACGADVLAKLPDGIEDNTGWMADIGALVRHSYQLHRCTPVEADASGLDGEQLDQLTRETELDMERLGKRFQELLAVARTPRTGGDV